MADLFVQATNEQHAIIKLLPKTARQGVGVLDGNPKITKLSGNGTFEVIDALRFKVAGPAIPDGVDTVFEVDGDPDLGPGVGSLKLKVTLTTTGAPAVTLDAEATIVDNP